MIRGLLISMILLVCSEAMAQDVTITADAWDACTKYQAAFRTNKATISKLSTDLEKEKHAASSCAGALEATRIELTTARVKASMPSSTNPSWLVFGLLIASGAATTAGGFIIQDSPVVGGVLLGAGSVGIIINGVFW